MNCIIIEDERNAIEYLESLLYAIDSSIVVQARIGSVTHAVKWLQQNKTDLIFLDVHLGDDLSFSIFDNVEVTTPVIFTTAYDNHAIEAFKLNSISYLLKPFEQYELQQAMDKFKQFTSFKYIDSNKQIADSSEDGCQKRFLVNFGNNGMKFIQEQDIAYFYTHKKYLFITCHDKQQYLFYGTLDHLERKLDPEKFFRINRKYIVSVNCIREMQILSRGRISIDIGMDNKDEMIVSVDRSNAFRKWLSH